MTFLDSFILSFSKSLIDFLSYSWYWKDNKNKPFRGKCWVLGILYAWFHLLFNTTWRRHYYLISSSYCMWVNVCGSVCACVHVCLHIYGYMHATECMWKTEATCGNLCPAFTMQLWSWRWELGLPNFTGTLLPAQPFCQPWNYSIFSFLFETKSQDIPQNSWCPGLSFSRSIDKGVHYHILLPFAFQIKKSNFRRCKWLPKFLSFMVWLRQPRDCSNHVGRSLGISETSQVFPLHWHWSKNAGLIEDILKFPFHPTLLVLALLHGYHLQVLFVITAVLAWSMCFSPLLFKFFSGM